MELEVGLRVPRILLVCFCVVVIQLVCSQPGYAANFPCSTSTLALSAQDGPVSNPTTWVGGAVPTDGNCVVIRHHVTLDSDWGSLGGPGLGWVRIENMGLLDADCQAPHTIYFGSTGTDPLGSGDGLNPGADATMFGFFVSYGTLNLSCPQPQNVTITSADDQSFWYIHHGLGDVIGCNSITDNVCNGSHARKGAILKLQNVSARHIGAAVTGYAGIDWNMTAGMTPTNSLTVSKNQLIDLYELTSSGDPSQTGSWSVTWNWFDTPRPDPSQALIYLLGTPGSWVINDNTVTNGQTESFFLFAPQGTRNLQMMRNAVLGSAAIPFTLAHINAGAGNLIQFNLCVNPEPPAPTQNPCVFIASTGVDNSTSVSFNVMQGGQGGISQIGDDPSASPTFGFNWISQWKEAAGAQGAIVSRNGTVNEIYNVLVMENADGHGYLVGNLAYSSTSIGCNAVVQQDHNTMFGVHNPSGDGNINYNWGDNSTDPNTCISNSYVRSNISYSADYGLTNRNNFNTWNLSDGIAYGGAAVHHNLTFGTTLASYQNTQTDPGFDNGSVPHPSLSQYGDLDGVDPMFLNTTRRPAGWDAICGGSGTNDSLFQNLARRSGFGGAYNFCYSIPSLWRWVRLGWTPLNPALYHAAHDGTYIGAVAPGRTP